MIRHPVARAFTLIELLVVVAIIALLIAILIPSLARARAQTRLIKCQAQLREYGRACMYYQNDFQDVFPPHRYDWEPQYGGYPHWFHLLDWYWRGTYAPPDPTLPLNEQEYRISRCPDLVFGCLLYTSPSPRD